MELWLVLYYNEVDAEFGYDCGPRTHAVVDSKAKAKSITRHMNKVTPDFITYYAEREPQRWT